MSYQQRKLSSECLWRSNAETGKKATNQIEMELIMSRDSRGIASDH